MWIWGKPIKLSDDVHLLLLDTEGLGSYSRDENIDAKLFTLTALMSSTMIYNVMGAIDERAIESLSFIANVSKFLNADVSDPSEDVSTYFPDLIWCVRDFALELVSKDKTPITSKEYMENCLATVQGDTSEAMLKNRVRRAICEYFKKRDCYTLVRPVTDENELREMERLPYEKIRPAFREEVENMISTVLKNVRPKIIKGCPVEGTIYTELILNFVDGLNNQALPSIPNTWERIIDREAQKYYNSATEYYMKVLKKETEGKLPMNDDVLNKLKSDIAKKAEAILLEYKYSDLKLQNAKERLQKKINEVNGFLDQENARKSKEFCTIFADKLIEKLEKDLKAGKYKHISHITREFYLYRKSFLDEARGPMKYEIFSGPFIEGFLRLMENYHSLVEAEWEKAKAEMERQLSELGGKKDALTLLLKQEKENAYKLMDELKARAEENRENLQQKIRDLTDQYEEKLEEAARWRQKLEGENENLKNIIEIMKIDKTYQAQHADNKKGYKVPENIVTSEDIALLKQTFKSDLDFLTESMKTLLMEIKKVNEEKFQLKLQYEKEKEINNLERKYNQQLNEARAISEETVETLKNSFEQEIKQLREENRKLEKSKENTVMALLEKEGKIKVLEEKMLSYVKENKTQIDHADMLCKISDQLLKLMKKLDKGPYDY